jgi:putative beta-lysine N-acetyltransferase
MTSDAPGNKAQKRSDAPGNKAQKRSDAPGNEAQKRSDAPGNEAQKRSGELSREASAPDRVEQWGRALVQHGPGNDRVYLMRLGGEEPAETAARIGELCRQRGYGKAFAKVPASRAAPFIAAGWQMEAYVPGFFRGGEDALFLCAYFDPQRRRHEHEGELLQRLGEQLAALTDREPGPLPSGMSIGPCSAADAAAMAELYRRVFDRYPFPIHDPAYIRETMESRVDYLGVWAGERLVGLSSAEREAEELNAEMTDFAVHPEYRGMGLALSLLREMERRLGKEEYCTLYTIARLHSPGMNAVFIRAGYRYSGTLFNNTSIAGGLESMNVFYKGL